MNRFEPKRRNRFRFPLLLLSCVILPLLFWYGVNLIDADSAAGREELLRTAITRDAVHCYAVEGFYPPNLSYLEEHYGLVYDRKHFFVDYQTVGANLLPEITVIRLDANEE